MLKLLSVDDYPLNLRSDVLVKTFSLDRHFNKVIHNIAVEDLTIYDPHICQFARLATVVIAFLHFHNIRVVSVVDLKLGLKPIHLLDQFFSLTELGTGTSLET